MFLIGKGIPEYIQNLPQTVLESPFGRLLKPQIDDMMKVSRGQNGGGLLGIDGHTKTTVNPSHSAVKQPTTMLEYEGLLSEAERSCAVIFFTSPTSRPCKTLYPLYDELAAAAVDKCMFIIVDVSRAFDIGTKYSISATPTFITILHNEKENRWSGADANLLRSNVQMLMNMAWPPHPHQSLNLPTLRGPTPKPILYTKMPPLEKLKAKMGPTANDPAVMGVLSFLSARSSLGAAEAPLPDLDSFSWFLRSAPTQLPLEILFTIVDLLRVALTDQRLSGYYAEEKDHKTIAPLISYVNSLADCPYSLRLVALQTACNLFSTPLYSPHVLSCPVLSEPIVQLLTSSLLDEKHHSVRVASASLLFNISTANSVLRREHHREGLSEASQIELAASLLEAIAVEEESPAALDGFLRAFGYLIYCAPKNGELVDLLKSMDAYGTIVAKKKMFPKEILVKEIGEELLGKGLD